MSSQLVLAVAVVFERLAQPAASLTLAFAIDIADAGARVHQAVAGVPDENADITDSQVQVFVALDAVDGQITDFLMDVEMSGRGDLSSMSNRVLPPLGA